MRLRWGTIWLSLGVVVFALATLARSVANQVGAGLYRAYNVPQSRSVTDARRQGKLVAEYEIEPKVLVREGKTFEFDEAWLEAAYEPRNFLIWYSYETRAGWSYLCVRPKGDSFHQADLFSMMPEYDGDFGAEGERTWVAGMTLLGNDVYFQRVRTDLPGLRLKVSAYVFSKARNLCWGPSG